MKKSSLYRFGALALVLAAVAVAHYLEVKRMAQALPGSATVAPAAELNQAALLADVRTLSSPEFEGRRTSTPGNEKARKMIEDRFRAIGLQAYGDSYRKPFSFVHKSIRGLLTPGASYETAYPNAANIIGYLPGSATPGKVMVISAHYDHLGLRRGSMHLGADDNASGVGALLAMAAWFKAHPPQHTIVFAAFDGEELGKQGAKAFVAALPFPREQLVMNLNMDMIGHNDQNQLFASGLYHTPALRPYLDQAMARSTVQVLSGHDRPLWLTGMVDDWTGSSDHAPFHDANLPYLYFGVEDHPDYHAPTDTFERLNQAFLGRAAELVLQTAIVLDKNLSKIGAQATQK